VGAKISKTEKIVPMANNLFLKRIILLRACQKLPLLTPSRPMRLTGSQQRECELSKNEHWHMHGMANSNPYATKLSSSPIKSKMAK
jgi:hypothetical protein